MDDFRPKGREKKLKEKKRKEKKWIQKRKNRNEKLKIKDEERKKVKRQYCQGKRCTFVATKKNTGKYKIQWD